MYAKSGVELQIAKDEWVAPNEERWLTAINKRKDVVFHLPARPHEK
jgi:hypothetical protein